MKTGTFTFKSVRIVAAGLFMLIAFSAKPNNVSITNFQYLTATQEIQFDVSWDNSWRNTDIQGSTQNYDGVWIFAKFRHACAKDSVFPSASSYKHMWLANSGHTIPVGATGELGSTTIGGNERNLGIFLYRSADGSGTFTLTGVKLKWDVVAQGITHDVWDIQVFAIEMVYIPEGSYYLGDGVSGNRFYAAPTASNPFLVASEGAITLSNSTAGALGQVGSNVTSSLPQGFPKGFDAFWCMKYEITQKQYCDYLNTLSRTHQGTAAPNVSSFLTNGNTSIPANNRGAFHTWSSQRSSYRNGIRVDGPAGNTVATIDPSKPVTFVCDLNETNAGNSADDGQSIACNLLQVTLLWRYLNWTGLRPMNELEFEKITRGTSVSPPYIQIPYESVWGNNASVSGAYTLGGTINNAGMANEILTSTGTGLVVGGATSAPTGPRRVGITHTATTTRLTAGSSFYGVADMAGNVDEIVIGVSWYTNSQPTYTTTTYGSGEAVNYPSQWPTGVSASSVGVLTKGGGWNVGSTWEHYTVSRRYAQSSTVYYASRLRPMEYSSYSNPDNANTWQYLGGRGVRNTGVVLP
jgi:hypothetical protein